MNYLPAHKILSLLFFWSTGDRVSLKNLYLNFEWGITSLRWETEKNENVYYTLIKKKKHIRKESLGHSPPLSHPPQLSPPDISDYFNSKGTYFPGEIRCFQGGMAIDQRLHIFQSTKQTPNIVLCGIFRYSCHNI